MINIQDLHGDKKEVEKLEEKSNAAETTVSDGENQVPVQKNAVLLH